jgi:predicted ferric reductase
VSTHAPTRTHAVPSRNTTGTRRHSHQALRRGMRHRRWQARTGDLLEFLALASLCAVVVQFLRMGGSHDLLAANSATRLIAVGRVTGLVSADLILIQLLLSARLPWVDRVYGMDRALKAHRILGRITVPLVLVHVEALVLGYAMRDGLSAWVGWAVEPFRMLTGVPDMLTAAAATALLVLIAVTSVRAAKQAMGYERWHFVHAGAYAAVALSLPHQLSIGSDLTRTPWAKTYWVLLYAAVAASVVWWRALVPVARTLRHDVRVVRVVEEAPGTWSIWLRGRDLDRLPARAGQYLGWRFLAPGLWTTAHPWSLSSMPDGRHLRVTVRDLGDHSRRVARLRPGTRALIEGPYGGFTTRSRTRSRVLLVAAGVGITPVRAILEELVRTRSAPSGHVTLVYRADHEEQLALRAELERLADAGGHRLVFLVGPPVRGSWLPAGMPGGDDAARLASVVPHLASHEAYLCGPAPWMVLAHRSLRGSGIPRSHIHDERFGW